MRERPLLWLATALALALALQGCCENNTTRYPDADADDLGGGGDGGQDAGDVGMEDAGDVGMEDAQADMPEEASLPCDGDELVGQVEASDWARRVAGIDHYAYTGQVGTNELYLYARDTQGQELASLVIYQVPEEGLDGLPDGAMVADFQTSDGGEGSLWSSARLTGDGYAVASRLQSNLGQLRTEARFELTRCAPTPQEGAPTCAWPLELGQGGVTMHDCGLIAWDQGQERQPRLAELLYVADQGQGVPEGGEQRTRGDARTSVLTVFDGEEITGAAQIDAWAQQVDAASVLGSPMERLLSTAHLDPTWRRRVRLHADRCQAALGGDLPTQQQGLSVRRQGLSPQGPGNRDSGRNLASGLKDLNKKISDAAPVKEVTICIPGTGCGKSTGDPHLTTFDGLSYDFQGSGEFVLARSRGGEPWEIQARFEPPETNPDERCRSVTVTTRVAFRFGGATWEVQLDPLRVTRDGQPADLTRALEDSHELVIRSGAVFVTWPNGASMELSGTTVQLSLPEQMQGAVEGLLGRHDGSDLLYDAQGLAYRPPLVGEQLYGTYGESWRVTAQDSLFTYEEDQGPEDFHDRSRPAAQITAADFTQEELAQAREVCGQMEIEDPWLLDACLLDSFCASAQVGSEAARGGSPRASMIPGAPLIKGPGRYRYVLEALPAQAPRSQGSCAEDGEPLALIYAEHEGTVTLEEPLQVNLAGPGTLEGEAATQELDAQVAVRSYAVFLPAVQELAPRSLQLTFSQPILGVITQGELLQSSDGALALEDLGWSPEPSRGLEPGRDAVTLAPDGRTLTVRMDGRDSEDMVRVLVEVNR